MDVVGAPPRPLLWARLEPSASAAFSVNDLSIDPGQVASITGQITSAQQTQPGAVPERCGTIAAAMSAADIDALNAMREAIVAAECRGDLSGDRNAASR